MSVHYNMIVNRPFLIKLILAVLWIVHNVVQVHHMDFFFKSAHYNEITSDSEPD